MHSARPATGLRRAAAASGGRPVEVAGGGGGGGEGVGLRSRRASPASVTKATPAKVTRTQRSFVREYPSRPRATDRRKVQMVEVEERMVLDCGPGELVIRGDASGPGGAPVQERRRESMRGPAGARARAP